MGVMRSDLTAVSCIVAGGILGSLGLSALRAGGDPGPAPHECARLIVTTATSPRVVVQLGERTQVVIGQELPTRSGVPRGECVRSPEALAKARSRLDVDGPRGTTLWSRVPSIAPQERGR